MMIWFFLFYILLAIHLKLWIVAAMELTTYKRIRKQDTEYVDKLKAKYGRLSED